MPKKSSTTIKQILANFPGFDPPARYVSFIEEAHVAGMEVVPYEGRYGYRGPAVICSDWDAFIRTILATTVPVQWDDRGKGCIVYPR
jgi:hypothetical protein